MGGTPSAENLTRQLAVLEERMRTMQAECRIGIATLAADNAKRDKGNLHWPLGQVTETPAGGIAE